MSFVGCSDKPLSKVMILLVSGKIWIFWPKNVVCWLHFSFPHWKMDTSLGCVMLVWLKISCSMRIWTFCSTNLVANVCRSVHVSNPRWTFPWHQEPMKDVTSCDKLPTAPEYPQPAGSGSPTRSGSFQFHPNVWKVLMSADGNRNRGDGFCEIVQMADRSLQRFYCSWLTQRRAVIFVCRISKSRLLQIVNLRKV